ncbi:GapS1 family protein [Pseudomonas yamanorum]|uniref:GapS1 family protein n=1 Tax=Pseudomonas yamanorum TaxID=515393 RepID=UPI003BA316DE
MSTQKYKRQIRNIKTELSSFCPLSVLNEGINYLGEFNNSERPSESMPWIIMLSIKLAMIEGAIGKRDIKKEEFIEIINKIYRMQHLAADVRAGNPIFILRPMIMQQAWYQRPSHLDWYTIFRQRLWYSESDYYEFEFHRLSGLSIDSYITISLFVFLFATNDAKNGIAELNILRLLYSLCPAVPFTHIKNYFLLTGVRTHDLPNFCKSNELIDEPQSEYFQPTTFRKRPLLIDGDRIYIFNSMVCTGGLATIIPTLLKENLKGVYKSRFGDDLENYISKLFLDANLEVLNEKDILDIYKKNGLTGKVCDFMLGKELNIIFESKAIEPGEIVLSTTDCALLKRSLPASLIKSIKQGQETAYNLKKIERYKNGKFALVIITHEDFWFATGDDITEFVDSELTAAIEDTFKEIPIPFRDVIFLTINTFESLLEAHKNDGADLENTISKCIEAVNNPAGRRFTMAHVAQDVLKQNIKGHEFVSNEADKWISALPALMKNNALFWGADAELLMTIHQRLMTSIDEEFERIK